MIDFVEQDFDAYLCERASVCYPIPFFCFLFFLFPLFITLQTASLSDGRRIFFDPVELNFELAFCTVKNDLISKRRTL